MKNLMKKSKKGFTLMEMLIVVAIIAILVVIAIPTFTNALEEARANTDLANVRAWYAEQLADAMTNENTLKLNITSGTTYTKESDNIPWGEIQGKNTNVAVSFDTNKALDSFYIVFESDETGTVTFGKAPAASGGQTQE